MIVGGGLAGLAAAAALAERGFAVTLLESRPRWGGRASSFVDQTTDEPIDNCQHVALGCCTNFLHFCRSVRIERFFHREQRLTFIGTDGAASTFSSAPLPAPFHLFPSFARLHFLSWHDKWRLAWGLRALARVDASTCQDESFLDWLNRHGQPPAVIERFWHVVLVSALSETLDRIDIGHARKVFVDSFLRNRRGWEVWLPTASLDLLYETVVEGWRASRAVTCRLQAGVETLIAERSDSQPAALVEPTAEPARDPAAAMPWSGWQVTGVQLRSGERIAAEHVIVAVPQFMAGDLLPAPLRSLPGIVDAARLQTAPISSVHLWFDRPITPLRHATFVGGLSQWLFNRSAIREGAANRAAANREVTTCYYQIVISASREVAARPQAETIRAVVAELAAIWPAAGEAQLVHSRLITEHTAVVSMLPGVDRWRSGQATPVAGLSFAGDWTQTGWPGTMEGAVRSGYLAAETVVRRYERCESLVQPDLPTALLPRWLLGL